MAGVLVGCLTKSMDGQQVGSVTLGHPLLDDYLEFVAARARPNTLLAVGYNFKVFFEVVAREPSAVTYGRCPECSSPCRWMRSSRRCARIGTGRWPRPWCWDACEGARCSGWGWPIFISASGGCSSPRARRPTAHRADLRHVLRDCRRLPGS